jgi:hypothetical protein
VRSRRQVGQSGREKKDHKKGLLAALFSIPAGLADRVPHPEFKT